MKEKVKNILSAIVLIGAGVSWFALFGSAIWFIFQGERFTKADGELLEMTVNLRLDALEQKLPADLQTPVMAFVKQKPGTQWKYTADSITGDFYGLKLRGCDRVVDSEMYFWRDYSGSVSDSLGEYVDDKTPNSTFPASTDTLINIEEIRWHGFDPQSAQAVGYTMRHDCDGVIVPSEFWFLIHRFKGFKQ